MRSSFLFPSGKCKLVDYISLARVNIMQIICIYGRTTKICIDEQRADKFTHDFHGFEIVTLKFYIVFLLFPICRYCYMKEKI